MFSSQHKRVSDNPEYHIHDAFAEFWERYGGGVLGPPIAEASEEDGVLTQYFERVALESPAPGEVRLKPLGREVLSLREEIHRPRPMVVRPPIVDVVYDLPVRDERRYETRALARIRQLVIHHTAADASVGVEAIARKHVRELGWPGIGYHFVIDASGQIYQTNNLTTVSYHARQANPTTVGIALCGNFDEAVPTDAQLGSAGELCAYLLRGLSLPIDNVRGHQALVSTECPGRSWADGPAWRETLIQAIRDASDMG